MTRVTPLDIFAGYEKYVRPTMVKTQVPDPEELFEPTDEGGGETDAGDGDTTSDTAGD